jgi:hypothetical protein
MDDTRWKRVEDLYHAARERAPEQREAFLISVCDDDLELRREVESLLSHSETKSLFLEPAWAGVLELAERQRQIRSPTDKRERSRARSFWAHLHRVLSIRVISSAIFDLVSPERECSCVITVYNGIRYLPRHLRLWSSLSPGDAAPIT